MGKNLCNSPLQTPVRQPASQQAASAVFQLPGAPGMQREPRRAAAQACVREQSAFSVPKKQPGGDFHPIGPSAATAAGKARLGLRREPRDGALHGSTERSLCYEVLCSVKPHSGWASLCTAARKGTERDRKMETREKGSRKTEHKERGARWNKSIQGKHTQSVRNAVKCYVDNGERLEYLRMGLEPNTVLLSLLTRCFL